MAKTVVGLFSSLAQAEQIKQTLAGEGYQHVTVVADNTSGTSTSSESESGSSMGSGTGIGAKISNFFGSLTGGDEDAHQHYASGVSQGGGLVAVTVEDSQASEVAAILKQHGARDIDGNTQAAQSGTPVYGGTATQATGQTAIPIVEESLVVGKREVERGGVRVYSHVVELPAEAAVTLRDEFINVERRFVDRPASEADFAAGSGGVVELTATGEEAVVGKTSRVVEEVLVGKEASQRTEAIHDSVRRTEVEVEEIPSQTISTGTTRTSATTGSDRF